MSKEQSTFIVDLIDIAKRAECTISITAKSGHVVCEVGPETSPFKVDEDGSILDLKDAPPFSGNDDIDLEFSRRCNSY